MERITTEFTNAFTKAITASEELSNASSIVEAANKKLTIAAEKSVAWKKKLIDEMKGRRRVVISYEGKIFEVTCDNGVIVDISELNIDIKA